MAKRAADFKAYARGFPEAVEKRLNEVRQTILSVAPHAEESIRYGMPAFRLGGTHLYIGGYKHHIGLYPMYGVPELEKIIAPFRAPKTKDTLHFKHSDALPLDMIRTIVRKKLVQ